MPRKIDPRLGEDGFHDVEPVCLDTEALERIARAARLDPDNDAITTILKAEVEWIGGQFRNWKDRGAGAFTRAEARRALLDLHAREDLAPHPPWALNERALQALIDALVMMPLDPGGDATVTEALLRGRIPVPVLRKALKAAADRLAAAKGADRDGEIAWATAELCGLYEGLTGRSATHSSKGRLLEYDPAPRSPAGRFVRACFAAFAPKVTATRISSALRRHLHAGGKTGRRRAPRRLRGGFRSRKSR